MIYFPIDKKDVVRLLLEIGKPGKGVNEQLDKNAGKKTDEQLLLDALENPNGNPENDTATKPVEPDNKKDSTESESPKDSVGNTETPKEEKLYVTPDGRKLTADQVFEEYNNLLPDYTAKSQELSKLKKSQEEITEVVEGNKSAKTLSPEQQAVLKELKETFGVMTKEEVDSYFESKKKELVEESTKASTAVVNAQTELKQALSELEEDFDGSEEEINGVKIKKPKVERKEVLDFIIANPSINMSPLEIAQHLHHKEFVEYEAKRLSAGSNGSANLPKTEDQGAGGGQTTPPQKPLNFNDGSGEAALREFLKQS